MPRSPFKTESAAITQGDLFPRSEDLPDGFLYRQELITAKEEAQLVRRLRELPFKPFDFHGHLANRQVVGFGLRYDYDRREVVEAEPIPDFLLPLRDKVARFASRPVAAFGQVLINEYREVALDQAPRLRTMP